MAHLSALMLVSVFLQLPTADWNDPVLPAGAPPVVGLAVASDGSGDEWQIRLLVPKVRWEVVGRVVPKSEWPQLKTTAEWDRRTVSFGGRSALAEARVVDLQGKDVPRADVLRRMKAQTAVLVSISGELVDPFYLRLTRPDTLVILLGPRESVPAPELLPAANTSDSRKK
jgi:hypothetical protein